MRPKHMIQHFGATHFMFNKLHIQSHMGQTRIVNFITVTFAYVYNIKQTPFYYLTKDLNTYVTFDNEKGTSCLGSRE